MNELLVRIKPFLLIVVGFLLFAGGITMNATAQNSTQFTTSKDIDADIVPRLSVKDAKLAISNRDNSVDLLLTNEAIVFQFTEDYLKEIADDIEESDKMHDSASFVQIFKEVISQSVYTLLDRAIAVPLSEIKQISYENGKIIIISTDDEELFEDLEINDKQILEDFSRRDAQRFVAESERRLL
ncbi:MAG: hypothetical protein WD381_08030 [Balneolaceae bacterium]